MRNRYIEIASKVKYLYMAEMRRLGATNVTGEELAEMIFDVFKDPATGRPLTLEPIPTAAPGFEEAIEFASKSESDSEKENAGESEESGPASQPKSLDEQLSAENPLWAYGTRISAEPFVSTSRVVRTAARCSSTLCPAK